MLRAAIDKHKHRTQQFKEIRVQNGSSISVMRNSTILTYGCLSSTSVEHCKAADGPYYEPVQSSLLLVNIFV